MPRRWSCRTSRRTTPNPNGGEILKDKAGNPTGLLRETASRLIRRGAGEPDADAGRGRSARRRRCSSWPTRKSISKGITSFQDAGSSFEVVNRMKRMIDAGRMNVRLWVMVRERRPEALAGQPRDRLRQQQLTVRAIKITGRRRARIARRLAARAVRRTRPTARGLATTPVERDAAAARRSALDAGYQVCIHAIGDRANREVLNIYEETFKKNSRERQGPALARRARAAHQRAPTSRASASSA